MNEEMQLVWLEISDMLGGEPTREELDVFLRTWQRASQATRKALAEQPAQQDSTCSNALRIQGKAYPRTCKKCGLGPCIADRVQPAQPAQRTWVGLTEVEVEDFVSALWPVGAGAGKLLRAIEAKLKEKNNG